MPVEPASGDAVAFEDLQTDMESRIGYRFQNPELMAEAITHKSWFNERNSHWDHNERFEFLGDAVLGMIIADRLMRLRESFSEGILTRFRAGLVNEQVLAEVAVSLNIGDLILLGRGEEKNNGHAKPSILSDALEAIIGAVFLDSDYLTCREIVLSWFEPMIAKVISREDIEDTKTRLQQKLQARQQMPEYHTVDIEGPDHDRTYAVEITADGRILGRGKGRSRKEAEKEAARSSLNTLEEEECTPDIPC